MIHGGSHVTVRVNGDSEVHGDTWRSCDTGYEIW